VILLDGMNLNHELVKQGWCWWYRKYALLNYGLRCLDMASSTIFEPGLIHFENHEFCRFDMRGSTGTVPVVSCGSRRLTVGTVRRSVQARLKRNEFSPKQLGSW
jgi:hypothetical protein